MVFRPLKADIRRVALEAVSREMGHTADVENEELEALVMGLWDTARTTYIIRRLNGEWYPDAERFVKPPPWFINPAWRTKRWWDIFLLLLVLFNAWEIPFVIGLEPSFTAGLDVIDYAIDILFAIDIVLTVFTAIPLGQGSATSISELQTERRIIVAAYMRGWLVIDVLSTVPYDLIIRLLFTVPHLRLLGFLKTPRLLRLHRLKRTVDRLSNLASSTHPIVPPSIRCPSARAFKSCRAPLYPLCRRASCPSSF